MDSSQPQVAPTGSLAAKLKARKNVYMRDPNTAPARVYIGNIAEGVTEEDLEEKFSPYGQISGKLHFQFRFSFSMIRILVQFYSFFLRYFTSTRICFFTIHG